MQRPIVIALLGWLLTASGPILAEKASYDREIVEDFTTRPEQRHVLAGDYQWSKGRLRLAPTGSLSINTPSFWIGELRLQLDLRREDETTPTVSCIWFRQENCVNEIGIELRTAHRDGAPVVLASLLHRKPPTGPDTEGKEKITKLRRFRVGSPDRAQTVHSTPFEMVAGCRHGVIEMDLNGRRFVKGFPHVDFVAGVIGVRIEQREGAAVCRGFRLRQSIPAKVFSEEEKLKIAKMMADFRPALEKERAGELDEVRGLVEETLHECEQVFGQQHPASGMCRVLLADLFTRTGHLELAGEILLHARRDLRRTVGPRHPLYGTYLRSRAEWYRLQERYSEAKALASKALEVHRYYSGENDLETSRSFNVLGSSCAGLGEFDAAEDALNRALEIQRRLLAPGNQHLVGTLSNLSELYMATGEVDRAESSLRQALGELDRGQVHHVLERAQVLHNLGQVCFQQSKVPESRHSFEQALAIRRRQLGDDHPKVAATRIGLAALYKALGDRRRSQQLLEHALPVLAAQPNENRDWYAAFAADSQLLDPETPNAGEFYRRWLTTISAKIGDTHPTTLIVRRMIGVSMIAERRFDEAADALEAVLLDQRRVLGERHVETLKTWQNLASAVRQAGDSSRSEELLSDVLRIRREAFGDGHPSTISVLGDLGRLHLATGDLRKAERRLAESLAIARDYLLESSSVLSQRQQMLALADLRTVLDLYLSVSNSSRSPEAGQPAYRHVLAWKGILLGRQQVTRRAATDDESVKPVLSRLSSVSTALANLSLQPPVPEKQERWRQQLAELTEKREQLEAELAERGFESQADRLKAAKVEGLIAHLPDDTVLVDFVEYTRSEPVDDRMDQYQALAAFVVCNDDAGPVRVELGRSQKIAEAIGRWRRAIVTDGAVNRGDLPLTGAFSDERVEDWALAVRRLIWDPLTPEIGTAKTVVISPDGITNFLPFGALPAKDGKSYLLEERRFAFLTSAGQLSESPQEPRGERSPRMLLVGGVTFDAAPGIPKLAAVSRSAVAPTDNAGEHRRFAPLPGTLDEVTEIGNLFHNAFTDSPLTVLSHQNATEDAVRMKAPGNHWLHFATHGFFFQQQASAVEGRFSPSDAAAGLPPTLQTGLALTGANRPHGFGEDDGLLTAMELNAIDLNGTELAVLSACETSLGQLVSGEGVLGLQRALQAAGVRSTVTSLWKVDDRATQVLMTEFYRNLWEKKLGKLESLRQAQLSMLRRYDVKAGKLRGDQQLPLVSQQTTTSTSGTPPFYWAAFVLSGDWR